MKQTIEASEMTLGGILSDAFSFVVPSYQRPYAWTTEHAGMLLEDLLAAAAIRGDDGAPPYFLGSVVLVKQPDNPGAEIVDGQQRLTTITLLLCALRELEQEDGFRNSLEGYICAPGNPVSGTARRMRFLPRERDRDFFAKHIQTQGGLTLFIAQDRTRFQDSQQRMHENGAMFMRALGELDNEKRQRLAQFMIQSCYLVVVRATDEDAAYRIFSVMNDRGLDLSPTDIIKAGLVGQMPEDEQNAATRAWEDMEEALGRDNFRDLFAHIRMIYARRKAERNLGREFRETVLARVNGQAFIDTVLVPYGEAFGISLKSSYTSENENADKVNETIDHLRALDNSDWVPSAMVFIDSFRDDCDRLFSLLRNLERLTYAFFLRRTNVNERIGRYARILLAQEEGRDLLGPGSPLDLTEQEIEELKAVIDGPVYLQARTRLPLLLRLDRLVADKGADYAHNVLSIEHVLPQTPAAGSRWLEWFPDEEARQAWTHRLANLVLLSRQKNSQAGRFDFQEKKEQYFMRGKAAALALTTQVLNTPEWTPEVLEERQQYLTGLLKREWRLD